MDIPAKNMVAVSSQSGLFSRHLDDTTQAVLLCFCCVFFFIMWLLEIFLSMKLRDSYGTGLENVFSTYIHKDRHKLSILGELPL